MPNYYGRTKMLCHINRGLLHNGNAKRIEALSSILRQITP